GVEIYSTVPGSKYQNLQGTSMASPIASGIAALIWSYFPDLTAEQVKTVITASSRKFDGLTVTQPGTGNLVKFSDLSISGGLVNAYDAVKMAESLKANPQSK